MNIVLTGLHVIIMTAVTANSNSILQSVLTRRGAPFYFNEQEARPANYCRQQRDCDPIPWHYCDTRRDRCEPCTKCDSPKYGRTPGCDEPVLCSSISSNSQKCPRPGLYSKDKVEPNYVCTSSYNLGSNCSIGKSSQWLFCDWDNVNRNPYWRWFDNRSTVPAKELLDDAYPSSDEKGPANGWIFVLVITLIFGAVSISACCVGWKIYRQKACVYSAWKIFRKKEEKFSREATEHDDTADTVSLYLQSCTDDLTQTSCDSRPDEMVKHQTNNRLSVVSDDNDQTGHTRLLDDFYTDGHNECEETSIHCSIESDSAFNSGNTLGVTTETTGVGTFEENEGAQSETEPKYFLENESGVTSDNRSKSVNMDSCDDENLSAMDCDDENLSAYFE